MRSDTPYWTWHAARRVIERNINPRHVLRLARAVIARGAARPGFEIAFEGRGFIVVMDGRRIITVHRRAPAVVHWRKPNRRRTR